MSGWQKRDERNEEPESYGQAGTLPKLIQSDGPAFSAAAPSLTVPPQFCPECGSSLNATAAYIPKFCTQCGHRLAAAASSGLDALLQATAAAKANGTGNDPAGSAANATLMGVSRTVMGVSRADLHTQTLMGVSRSELYDPQLSRARSQSTRARIHEARRAGGKAPLTRSVPPSVPTSVPASAPPRAVPALPPSPAPAPPPPTPTAEAQSTSWGNAFFVFSVLFLLAVLAAAGAFWLARQGILHLPI